MLEFKRFLTALTVFVALVILGFAQGADDRFSTSSCMGCHGQSAMGGLGPPLAKVKLTFTAFSKTVREGKGMMPATPVSELSDKDLQQIYSELQAKPWREDQIPIAFKVGQVLTTTTLSHIFLVVFGLSFLFGVRVLWKWLNIAGLGYLWPYLKKFGYLKAAGVAIKSLIVDGFFVISLYRRNRFRWLMHGLILYGFCGLILADVLLAIYNPTRGHLPFTNPLKILPVVSGIAVVVGVGYVMYRYKKDKYVDNGLTLGRDFAFVTLLFHTVFSGFLVVWINRTAAHDYVMPIYLYHLVAISLLILTAPFTRFQHAFVVPALVAVTRLTEAVTASGVGIGFRREPSPGRHHKSERIVADLLTHLGPEYDTSFRIRYYP